MITSITQQNEGERIIKTYQIVARIADQGTLLSYTDTIADVFFEKIQVIPLWLSPRVMDAMVLQLPDDQLFNNLETMINQSDFPELNMKGYGLQIQQNYSLISIDLPVFKNYNGKFIINFENEAIDPNQATGYLVKVYLRQKKGN